MFNKKNDPLVESVKKVMQTNDLFREIEQALLEEFGVESSKALPAERLVQFNAILAEAKKCAMEEGSEGTLPKTPKEKALASLKEPKHKITHADVLKGRGVIDEKEHEEKRLDEKAVSKAQHRFFGLVRGIQKGQAKGSAKAEKAAKEMSAKEVKKFSGTKEKGLPERVDEGAMKSIMRKLDKASGDQAKRVATLAKNDLEDRKEKLGLKRDYSGNLTKASREKMQGDKRLKSVAKRMMAAKNPDEVKTNYMGSGKTLAKESVIEEIRKNLEEQLASIHESGDEQAFTDFISSLTEEQIEILGLNEGRGTGGATAAAARAAENPAPTTGPLGLPGGSPFAAARAAAAKTPAPKPTVDPESAERAQAATQRTAASNAREMGTPSVATKVPTPTPATRPSSAPATAAKPAPAPAARPAQRPAMSQSKPRGGYEGSSWQDRAFGREAPSYVMRESLESFLRNKFLKD